jgi:hypothetical protein
MAKPSLTPGVTGDVTSCMLTYDVIGTKALHALDRRVPIVRTCAVNSLADITDGLQDSPEVGGTAQCLPDA